MANPSISPVTVSQRYAAASSPKKDANVVLNAVSALPTAASGQSSIVIHCHPISPMFLLPDILFRMSYHMGWMSRETGQSAEVGKSKATKARQLFFWGGGGIYVQNGSGERDELCWVGPGFIE